jgi:hypothetical protein
MSVIRTALVMLASSWLVLSGSAWGQAAPPAPRAPLPPLSDSLRGEAKAEYEAARILFGDTDYAGALVKFEHAFEHSQDARLLWNMAVCEKNLRHYVRVLVLLERYRRDAGSTLSDAQRSDVMAVLQTVQSLISEVRLTVDQSDAEVFLDDVLQGRSPLQQPLLVDLGSRRLRVVKPGFQEWQMTREFAGHSIVVLSATLKPVPQDGQLNIFSDPDSVIMIDGVLSGTAHFEGAVPAGHHTVTIRGRGKLPFSRELELNVDEARTLHVTLQSEPSHISPWIWVAAGVVVAGGLATGGYFLFRSTPTTKPTVGTLPPGVITVPQ